MSRKSIVAGGLVLLAVGAAVLPLQAQRGPGFQRGQGFQGASGPHVGRSVELALEEAEALELTQEQTAELQELKAVMDGEIKVLEEEMAALRTAIRDGEVDRDEGHRQMVGLRGELMTATAPLRGRVQEILTVQQHARLQGLIRQDLPGAGGGRAALGNCRAPRGGGPGAFQGLGARQSRAFGSMRGPGGGPGRVRGILRGPGGGPRGVGPMPGVGRGREQVPPSANGNGGFGG